MTSLFDVEIGETCDVGYLRIRNPSCDIEQNIHRELEQMWATYEPYAEPNFKKDFSLELQSHFWEMKLACDLLGAGINVLRYADRRHPKGNPDICFIHDEKKVWIEAVAPKRGQNPHNSVIDPPAMEISQDGIKMPERFLHLRPSREIALRISNAFSSKSEITKNYVSNGVVAEDEVILVAISGANFGLMASDDLPDIVTALLPVGDQIAIYDPNEHAIVDEGFEYSPLIPKVGAEGIPRDLLLSEDAKHISGVIWSRVSVSKTRRADRPTSILYNPNARNSAPRLDGFCDRNYSLAFSENNMLLKIS